MIGKTNAGGGVSGGFKYVPSYSGNCNMVLSEDGSSGYIECLSSGILTWFADKMPDTVDVTCIGGGGGGSQGRQYDEDICNGGSGGGGGFVKSAYAVQTANNVEVTVGAGASPGGTGGTSSYGSECTAAGGTPGGNVGSYAGAQGGSGGNAGGVGFVKYNSINAAGKPGCSGGLTNGTVSNSSYQTAGTSQGTPTVDILGRTHAGGGGGGGRDTNANSGDSVSPTAVGFAGGTSDCVAGSGSDGAPGTGYYYGKGGGGYGGGGGGGGHSYYANSSSFYGGGAGGQGLVVIGWGDYLSLYEGGAA